MLIRGNWAAKAKKVIQTIILSSLAAGVGIVVWLQVGGHLQGIDWPAWVQAVGSVVGIWAAWWIPHKHELSRETRQRDGVLRTLRTLAEQQMDLYSDMQDAMRKGNALFGWQSGRPLDTWNTNKSVVAAFPVESMIGLDISVLLTLREGAEYGEKCAKDVMKWGDEQVLEFSFPDIDNPLNMVFWHMTRLAEVIETISRCSRDR